MLTKYQEKDSISSTIYNVREAFAGDRKYTNQHFVSFQEYKVYSYKVYPNSVERRN